MSAKQIAIDPGYGFAEITVGKVKSAPIDLYAASEHFDAVQAQCTNMGDGEHPVDWDAVWTKMRKYLAGFGLDMDPDELSTAGVVQIVNSIRDGIADLQKKDRPPASSGGAD